MLPYKTYQRRCTMSRNYSTTITHSRERGQHLKFEDRVSIKIYRRLKYTLRAIAEALACSPSTIMYELRRGTGKRKGSRGRFPEYSLLLQFTEPFITPLGFIVIAIIYHLTTLKSCMRGLCLCKQLSWLYHSFILC